MRIKGKERSMWVKVMNVWNDGGSNNNNSTQCGILHQLQHYIIVLVFKFNFSVYITFYKLRNGSRKKYDTT